MTAGALEGAAEAARQVLEELRAETEQRAAWHGISVEFRTTIDTPFIGLSDLADLADEVGAELVVFGASTALGHRVGGPSARR